MNGLTINDVITVLGDAQAAEAINAEQFVLLLGMFNSAVLRSGATVGQTPLPTIAPPTHTGQKAPRSESRRSASDADSLDPPPEGATGIEVLAYEGDPGAEPPLGKYAKAIPVVGYTPNPLPVKE